MRKLLPAALAGALVILSVAAPAASAKEKLLTLYSPKIESLPYVHDTHEVPLLKADGNAPSEPGYILGYKEMALVDSKDPKAKPLPIAKMMVHHFLYWAPGRVNEAEGSCWRGAGFIGGRGEEHPLGRTQLTLPEKYRGKYGIENRKADGTAPDWRLTAMVMNHYKRPKSFYVRTKVWYTTDEAQGGASGGDRRLRPGGQRHVLRRAGWRQEGLQLREQERLDRPLQRPHARGRLSPSRRRQVPDAREPHLRPAALQGARLPRHRRPPLQHDPPHPPRARPGRKRELRQRHGHPGGRGRGAAPRGGARQPQPARGLHGLLDHLVGEGRVGQALRQDPR